MTTAGAIDRVVHRSVILELKVKIYRFEQAGARKTATDAAPGACPPLLSSRGGGERGGEPPLTSPKTDPINREF